jgi:hypothetical protein
MPKDDERRPADKERRTLRDEIEHAVEIHREDGDADGDDTPTDANGARSDIDDFDTAMIALDAKLGNNTAARSIISRMLSRLLDENYQLDQRVDRLQTENRVLKKEAEHYREMAEPNSAKRWQEKMASDAEWRKARLEAAEKLMKPRAVVRDPKTGRITGLH